LESAPELRGPVKLALDKLVGSGDAFGDESTRAGVWVPTSADELACMTNVAVDFMQSSEAKKALETWTELGTYMSPCLRSLLGYPQYMHPVPFESGRDPLKKFIVTIVKVDDRMESIKLATSASETVGQLVAAIFEKFAHGTSGLALDSAGPGAFGLKVVSRAEYLVDRACGFAHQPQVGAGAARCGGAQAAGHLGRAGRQPDAHDGSRGPVRL